MLWCCDWSPEKCLGQVMSMEAIYSFFSVFVKVETLQGAWKTLVLAKLSLVALCSPLFLLSCSHFSFLNWEIERRLEIILYKKLICKWLLQILFQFCIKFIKRRQKLSRSEKICSGIKFRKPRYHFYAIEILSSW